MPIFRRNRGGGETPSSGQGPGSSTGRKRRLKRLLGFGAIKRRGRSDAPRRDRNLNSKNSKNGARKAGAKAGAGRGSPAATLAGAPPLTLGDDSLESAKNIPIFDRSQNRLYMWLVKGMVLLGLLFFTLFFAQQIFFSGAGGGDDGTGGMSQADREQAARALAEEFSQQYLAIDPSEDPRVREKRLSAFLADGLKPKLVAQSVGEAGSARDPAKASGGETTGSGDSSQGSGGQGSGVSTQTVLSSAPYHTETLSGGNYVVQTTNLVRKKDPNLDPKKDKEKAQQQAIPQTEALEVYVGVDDAGQASVLAPPTLIAAPGGYSGGAGALVSSSRPAGEEIQDDNLKSLLAGYFSAFYGRSESRNTLDKFFAPEAKIPPQPPQGYSFVKFENGKLYPRLATGSPQSGQDRKFEALTVGGVEFQELYDAELYVTVTDEEGVQALQTQLVTVGKTSSGDWLLAGEL